MSASIDKKCLSVICRSSSQSDGMVERQASLQDVAMSSTIQMHMQSVHEKAMTNCISDPMSVSQRHE